MRWISAGSKASWRAGSPGAGGVEHPVAEGGRGIGERDRAERLDRGAELHDGRGAFGTGGEVRLDLERLVDVDGVEDVGGQEGVGGRVVDGHAHCSLRSGVTSSATRASARRRRDLAVPSGMPSAVATCR